MRKSVETFQLHQCNACTELDAAKAPVKEDVVNQQSSNHCHSKAAPSMPMLEQSLQLEVEGLNEEVVAKNGVNLSPVEHLQQCQFVSIFSNVDELDWLQLRMACRVHASELAGELILRHPG
jgi:hypothetical protein